MSELKPCKTPIMAVDIYGKLRTNMRLLMASDGWKRQVAAAKRLGEYLRRKRLNK